MDSSAALGRVLDDAVLAAELVAAGEARAAELSMERLAERYVGLYERVVARRQRAPAGADPRLP